jgi:Amidase
MGADDWCPYTFPFNLTGQPAASAPCGLVDGLPVGIQIVGPHLGDAAHARRLPIVTAGSIHANVSAAATIKPIRS